MKLLARPKNAVRASLPGMIALMLSSFSYQAPGKATSLVCLYDTAVFQPNTALGWGAHSSYATLRNDSVQLEVILFRTVPANNDWTRPSYSGKVGDNFRPGHKQTIDYVEYPRTWRITVETDGTCYLKVVSGVAPAGPSMLLPVQTRYKK